MEFLALKDGERGFHVLADVLINWVEITTYLDWKFGITFLGKNPPFKGRIYNTWRMIPLGKWLDYHGDRKFPNWDCGTPSKSAFHSLHGLYISGGDLLTILTSTGMIL